MNDKKQKTQKNDDEILDEKADDKNAEEELEKEDEEVENEQVAQLKEKNKNLEDQLKRAVADYRNLEKRIAEERIEFIKFANKNLLESLLPAFDTLLLASKYSEDQNLLITAKYLLDILAQAGVERVKTEGEMFNPAIMEAVEVVEGKEGKVIEETQPGFLLNGKVIRPARVKVGGAQSSK